MVDRQLMVEGEDFEVKIKLNWVVESWTDVRKLGRIAV